MSKLDFSRFATKLHNIEVTIANCWDNSFNFIESNQDKAECKRNVYFSKNSTKDAMSISKAELV